MVDRPARWGAVAVSTALWTAALFAVAGCHETDNLGGTLAFRVDVSPAWTSQSYVAGTTVDLEVAVRDGMSRHAVRGRAIHLSLIGSGGDSGSEGFLSPRTFPLAGGATTTTSVKLLRAGRFRLRASASDCAPWLGPSFEVRPAAASHLAFVNGPRDAREDDPQRVVVEVLDAFGNRVTGAVFEVALGDLRAQTVAGVAAFDTVVLAANSAEASTTVELRALAPGLEDAVAGPVVVGAEVLAGTLTYARVPVRYDKISWAAGLDYASEHDAPIAGARVQLVDGDEVLVETTSGDDGSFRLVAPAGRAHGLAGLAVRALAQTLEPPVRVADNTAGGVVYALESAPLVATSADRVLKVHAPSGWTGKGYGAERAAAPFALLHTVNKAVAALVPAWSDTLPPLTLYWSEGNHSVEGDLSKGQVGTSHYAIGGSALYVLGEADSDTDEYDEAVVVHEWGHFLFSRGIGRSDTIGGSHGTAYVLDPRTAFEEGVCNTLAGIAGMTGTRPLYADTLGPEQSFGWYEELERNLEFDPDPGWFSEATVQTLVYDLADGVAGAGSGEAFDAVGYGWKGVLELFEDARDMGPYVTIYSVLEAARRRHPQDVAAIDRLATLHEIHGVGAYAQGEVADGGWAANLPLFPWIPEGGDTLTVMLEGAGKVGVADWANRLAANRTVVFVGDGRTWEVGARSDHDVDLYVIQDGWPLLKGRGLSGDETLVFTTQPGAIYTANLRSWHAADERYTATLAAHAQIHRNKKRPPAWLSHRTSASTTGPRVHRRARWLPNASKEIRGGLRVLRGVVRR